MKKKLKNLQINMEEVTDMEKSIYSEIGNDGLRFLKQDIHITSEGLMNVQGQLFNSLLPTNKHNLINSEVQLGKGSACHVQQGIYKPLEQKVAIKVLIFRETAQNINVYDRDKRHQIMNDIKILLRNQIEQQQKGYKCDFIVTLYGAYFDEGSVKVILELMDCGSLQNIIKVYSSAKLQPQINERVLAKIAMQILCGLAHLHVNNQLHRDVKPGNVLINSKGQVKLTDFGIAKELSEEAQSTKTSVGTRSYMSPERIRGGHYDYKSDIWGFGLIMYELCSGRLMLHSMSQFDMLKQFELGMEYFSACSDRYSAEFNNFLACALEVDPEHRWSAMELVGHDWILKNISADREASITGWLDQIKNEVVPGIIQNEKQSLKFSWG